MVGIWQNTGQVQCDQKHFLTKNKSELNQRLVLRIMKRKKLPKVLVIPMYVLLVYLLQDQFQVCFPNVVTLQITQHKLRSVFTHVMYSTILCRCGGVVITVVFILQLRWLIKHFTFSPADTVFDFLNGTIFIFFIFFIDNLTIFY